MDVPARGLTNTAAGVAKTSTSLAAIHGAQSEAEPAAHCLRLAAPRYVAGVALVYYGERFL
jgi:hypothetical protein